MPCSNFLASYQVKGKKVLLGLVGFSQWEMSMICMDGSPIGRSAPATTAAAANYNGASSISPISTGSPLTDQDNTRDNELVIWQEDYWQQMLADFKQLKLYDFSWLEPINDVVSQAECIFDQILYPGMDTSNKAAQHKTYQEPDMLQEVINKLGYITQCSVKLIQLLWPFVEEIVKEESGTCLRLINRSDQLENVLTKLRERVTIMKKLNAKNVRLDMLLHNFKDVTKDRRLFHDHSIGEVIRKMAESIYNCKNSIGLLCMETKQSTMVEFVISTLQQGSRHHRYYIHTIDMLFHLACKLNDDLAEIRCSRDRLFNNEFSDRLIEIMKLEKQAAPIFGTFKNHDLDQYHSIRLKAYLKDTRVLQQAYKNWKELRRQKYVTDTSPKEHSISNISWLEFDPKDALDVVLQWDPFNSMSCIGHALISVHIFSHAASAGSSSIYNFQNYAKTILQVASSRLIDLFHCLINANAAFHNIEVIHAYAYAQHPSRWFCASSGASSSSGEQGSLCLSSFSSSCSASLSSHPIEIPAPKIRQQRPTFEIEPTYEKEKASDGRIFSLFCDAISNLKQLASMLVHSKCGHVLSKAFQEAFQDAMEQKLVLLGFHQGARKKLEKLSSTEASALKERRRDWERAFKAVVYALLPWPKYLCDEIFSDSSEELKEVCFYEYAKHCLMPLLEFVDAASSANSGRVERIFHQLYVHEVLSELSANIPILFSGSESTQLSYSGEEMAVLMRLEKAILEALADFNNQLQDDISGINENEVDVHHLTHRTMSFVKELSSHRITINSLLSGEVSFSSRKCLLLSDQSSYNRDVCIDASDCRELMFLLLSCLESKLVQKSELLKASVAKQVFWINNLDYMIEEAVNPQLKIILGEEWVQEQNKKIQRYQNGYVQSVSTEAQSCLDASKGSARKRLKSFKLSIEEICKVRASWKVPNPRWRCVLRNAALDAVVSAYASFRDKLPPEMLKTKTVGLAQLTKVDPVISIEEDLEGLKPHLLDLFEG